MVNTVPLECFVARMSSETFHHLLLFHHLILFPLDYYYECFQRVNYLLLRLKTKLFQTGDMWCNIPFHSIQFFHLISWWECGRCPFPESNDENRNHTKSKTRANYSALNSGLLFVLSARPFCSGVSVTACLNNSIFCTILFKKRVLKFSSLIWF